MGDSDATGSRSRWWTCRRVTKTSFIALAGEFEALLSRKGYGRSEIVRDEAQPQRFYDVRHWVDAEAAERSHADREVQALTRASSPHRPRRARRERRDATRRPAFALRRSPRACRAGSPGGFQLAG